MSNCPSCIFVSCRQKKSASSDLNASLKYPLPSQALSPFTFQLINFMIHYSFSSAKIRISERNTK